MLNVLLARAWRLEFPGEWAVVLPNFIHIGPAKAGSSWLHDVLSRHPNIFMTKAKELYFFDRYFDRGLPWYRTQFRGAGPEHTIVGEVCPLYLPSPETPQRMYACLGDNIRLMVTLRDPVERAFSHYLYMLKRGIAPSTFRKSLKRRPELLGSGMYATHLKRYLRYFDRDTIYVALFDDLRHDPQAFLDRLLSWLEVPPLVLEPPQRTAKLPASRARSVLAARAVRRAAEWAREQGGATLVGQIRRSPLVHRALFKPLGEAYPEISEDDARYIRSRLEPEIASLEEMLELPLRQQWGWHLAPQL